MNIHFYTLGCKVNQYETQVLREKAEEKGYEIVEADGEFDVLVINSCKNVIVCQITQSFKWLSHTTLNGIQKTQFDAFHFAKTCHIVPYAKG